MLVRWIAALLAFLAVAGIGIVAIGDFSSEAAANTWALVAAVGLLVAFVVYAGIEYAQTGGFASIARQFDLRTLVLMPVAIAINIILGAAVANALKIPIYLDSIGTILVGALAGPIPGALTGFVTNILWQYVIPPPFQGAVAAPFAIVAAVIGLLAGVFGRVGWLRPRIGRPITQLVVGGIVALAVVGGLAYYAYTRFYEASFEFFKPENTDPLFVALGWLVALLFVAFAVGFLVLLFVRRDLTVAYVTIAGVITGVVAALISAPISANLFSGVTGAGTDFLVAAFRQAGSDIQAATFQQGLLSDPVDKLVTFFAVYLVLNAMARRVKARFPQGERLVEREAGVAAGDDAGWRGAGA
ncbi:MAG TPA: ECF transporter S component [Candidatus Limnocylindria bacterium]